PGRDILALAADRIRHAAEKDEIAVRLHDAQIAGVERAVAQRLRRRLGITEIAGEHRVGPAGAHNDLAALARRDHAPTLVLQLDREPRHRLADCADRAAVVPGGDARRFGHAVALANRDAETLLERSPDVARTAAAPGDADAVRAVERSRRLLQQDL